MLLTGHPAATSAKAQGGKRFSKSRPYHAKVVAVQGLCQVQHKDDKDTFRVEFDLGESGLTYLPGDAVGIYPSNCTQVRTSVCRTDAWVSYCAYHP